MYSILHLLPVFAHGSKYPEEVLLQLCIWLNFYLVAQFSSLTFALTQGSKRTQIRYLELNRLFKLFSFFSDQESSPEWFTGLDYRCASVLGSCRQQTGSLDFHPSVMLLSNCLFSLFIYPSITYTAYPSGSWANWSQSRLTFCERQDTP